MTLHQKLILRRNVMKLKQLEFVVYVKLKRKEIGFIKLEVYVNNVVTKKFHVHHLIFG